MDLHETLKKGIKRQKKEVSSEERLTWRNLTAWRVQGIPLQTPSEQSFGEYHLEWPVYLRSPWCTHRDAEIVGENRKYYAHFTPVILDTQEDKQENHGQRSNRQAWDPVWKQTKSKRTGGMAQVVQCLPSNFKALSSDASAVKEKKPSLWSMTCTCYQSSDLELGSLPLTQHMSSMGWQEGTMCV
jgi:hypothetical protein